jgi:hypothetical protein
VARGPHTFGPDAFRLKGGLADEPARVLMGLFHDHMARRTVENPDLEHRARRLGLIGKIREMEEQGFTVIERAISDGFADEVRAAIKGAVLPQQGVAMNWMLYQGRPFERITLNPLAMTLIDASARAAARNWPPTPRSSAGRDRAVRHPQRLHRCPGALSGFRHERGVGLGLRGLDRGLGPDLDRAGQPPHAPRAAPWRRP